MSTSDFRTAVEALTAAQALANERKLSPLEHGRQREAALGQALVALAGECGVLLRQPLYLNSNGEFSLVTVAPAGSPHGTLAPYGDRFASMLTRHSPRTGVQPGAHLMPENQWCWLNHFSAEKLVLEQAEQALAAHAE